MGEKSSIYKVLVGKFEGKKPLGSHKNSRIIIKWISDKENGGVDWIHLAQYRAQWKDFADTLMNLRNFIKYWEFLEWFKDSAPCKLVNSAHSRCLSTHDIKIFQTCSFM
jgi:hypothetical protein